MASRDDADELLTEQLSCYRAIASEHGDHAATPTGRELMDALDRFRPTGTKDFVSIASIPSAARVRPARKTPRQSGARVAPAGGSGRSDRAIVATPQPSPLISTRS